MLLTELASFVVRIREAIVNYISDENACLVKIRF